MYHEKYVSYTNRVQRQDRRVRRRQYTIKADENRASRVQGKNEKMSAAKYTLEPAQIG
jgi:hypothetical protein